MKKALVAGAASLALAAVPVVGVFAATTLTDTISVTVSDNCALSYGSTAHTAGDGTWSSNTLSATRTNGTVTYNLGKTTMKAVCNNSLGYKVAVKTLNNLTSGSNSIPAYTGASSGAGSAYTASVSGWSPIIDSGSAPTASSTKYKQGDTVKTESAVTAGTSFSVYYGVGINSTQAAGTYSGTVVYELTKLSS